jgi:PIN domain nuclease of toxin-antitoxin system
MRFLLDAHALLWFLAGDARLSTRALECIQDTRNVLFLSPATLWEIGIKDALGKLTLPDSFAKLFPERLCPFTITTLSID